MIKILVVEDEQEKRRLVSAALLACDGVSIDNVVIASDAYEAKRQISNIGRKALHLEGRFSTSVSTWSHYYFTTVSL